MINQTFANMGSDQNSRILQLDGLRALAFLSVFLWHAAKIPSKICLWAGVDLFFVLSGFLITGILLGSKKHQHEGYFREFYIRRARRIFPPYLIALAFAAVLFNVALGSTWPWYAFFVSNIGQSIGANIIAPMTTFWSLAVEEQFYIFWPFVVLFTSVKTLSRICVAGIITVPVLRAFLSHDLSLSGGIGLLTPFRLDLLMAGALIAIAWRRPAGLSIVTGRLATPIMCLSVAVYAIFCTLPNFKRDNNSALFDGLGYSLVLTFCAALLVKVLTLTPAHTLYRVLTIRPMAYLGRISYMMYLLHSTCIMLAVEYLNGYGRLLSRAAALLGTIGLAAASWHLIEKRLLNIRKPVLPKPKGAFRITIDSATGEPDHNPQHCHKPPPDPPAESGIPEVEAQVTAEASLSPTPGDKRPSAISGHLTMEQPSYSAVNHDNRPGSSASAD